MPTPTADLTTYCPLHRLLGACLGLLGFACSSDPDQPVGPGDPASSSGSTGPSAPQDPTSMPTSTSGEPGSATGTTSTADTSSEAGSTGATAICGDGAVDPGEQCDDGLDNREDGSCTLDCKVAVCGDGKIHAGVEACDLGADNSDAYGGCGDCQYNAFCGDGVQDPVEQCDAGAKNGSGESPENTAPCTVGCRWDARLVFLSSTLHDGDFGGLDGADLRCRTLAQAAGIASWATFRAWLADANVGPLERFVLLPAKPYALPTGERIADSLGDLVLNGPGDGIRVDETGKPLPSSFVWTNVGVTGEPHSAVDHCQHWDAAAFDQYARMGWSHVAKVPEETWQAWSDERQWTSLMLKRCNASARLYCFEN